MLTGFNALAELYYAYWGEFFHLAVFEPGDDPADVAAAYQHTHRRYLDAIEGATAERILDVACGGGALSAWLADHTNAQVLGVDLSDAQLTHARGLLAGRPRPNPRFAQHDVMRLADLAEPPFDAAICLDAACYLPDRTAALRAIATRLRPGGRLLLVDWCRAEHITALQRELILQPLCRYWAIADLETAAGYRRSFQAAGFRLHRLEDLSDQVLPNWERGYQAALRALSEPIRLGQLLRLAADTVKHGALAVQAAKTNSRSRYSPKRRPSLACCATCPSSPNAASEGAPTSGVTEVVQLAELAATIGAADCAPAVVRRP
jgi:SAM-dependent methyltransferase